MSSEWISSRDAYSYLKTRFDTLRALTIRKAILGMIRHTEFPVICTDYDESAYAYLSTRVSISANPYGKLDSPPSDFWNYDLALRPDADASFSSGNFSNARKMNAADLPYRFFKNNYVHEDQIDGELFQTAYEVSFSQRHLESLIADRRWSIVWAERAEPKAPGRKKTWQWDDVKAQLTVDIARQPELLSVSASTLAAHMTDLFEALHGQGNAPDRSDIFDYVQKIRSCITSGDTAPS